MNQTSEKKRPHVEEESQKKRQRRTIADCVFVVFKHSLEILNWMDNSRKHFYCAAGKAYPLNPPDWLVPGEWGLYLIYALIILCWTLVKTSA